MQVNQKSGIHWEAYKSDLTWLLPNPPSFSHLKWYSPSRFIVRLKQCTQYLADPGLRRKTYDWHRTLHLSPYNTHRLPYSEWVICFHRASRTPDFSSPKPTTGLETQTAHLVSWYTPCTSHPRHCTKHILYHFHYAPLHLPT